MKSIILKIEFDNENERQVVRDEDRIYSSIFRYAFNRFLDEIPQKEIYKDLCEKFQGIGTHILNSALNEAKWDVKVFNIQKSDFEKKEENKNQTFKRRFGKLRRF